MKIDTKEATVEASAVFGESVDMGISARGVVHLMSLLTNLYNDPETAVIREYYTNALDAHTRVGQARPVEIFLPTRDNPLYVVKDFGVGMSAHDIKHIYSQYGESTKQDTNDEIGAYGLGCKSALAIATQFTLTTVKDGLKTTALVGKTESGINNIDILPSKATEEPNGTTVTIPVPNVTAFNEKVSSFFKYSDPEKVKINGHHPESVLGTATKLVSGVPGLEIYTKEKTGYYGSPEFKVIMGNVPYDFSSEKVAESLSRQKINFDVDYARMNVYFVVSIGAVDLTPSREGLRYTDKTEKQVDAALQEFVRNIRAAAQSEINDVEKRHEVFPVIKKWGRILNEDDVTWKGSKVPQHFTVKDKIFKTVQRYGSEASHSTTRFLPMNNTLTLVHGRDPEEYKKVSIYLTPYMDSEDISTMIFYFTDEIVSLNDPWVMDNEQITVVHADKIVEIGKAKRKADREAAKGQLKSASTKFRYPVLDIQEKVILNTPYDLIPDGTPYLHVDDFSRSLGGYFSGFFNGKANPEDTHKVYVEKKKNIAEAMSRFTSSRYVVIIGGNRKLSALQDRIKGTYNVTEDFEKTINNTFRSVHQNVKDIASLRGSSFSNLIEVLKKCGLESSIKDRDFRRLMNPRKKAKHTFKKLTEYEQHLKLVQPNSKRANVPSTSTAVRDLMIKYPLIESVSYYNLSTLKAKHMVTYINAVHDEEVALTADN
jgi:hypothetical protein